MKSTKGEVRKRVELIAKVILFGGEFSDIRAYAQEEDSSTGRPWNKSDGQLWRYQKLAYELIERQVEKDRPKVWARHIQQRRQMFALAMEAGDLGAALQVVKDEADLHGLYPTTGKSGPANNTQVNVVVNNGNRITVDEFRSLPLEERIRILRGPVMPPIENRERGPDAV